MAEHYLLEMKDISKAFPGVQALDHVKLQVRPGTVHSLMGENGAGKSTLMKCLFGIYNKDSGHVYFEGKEVNFSSPKDALEHGVAMVHQELNQVMKRPVMENIMLGRFPKKLFYVDEKAMLEFTQNVFNELNLNINPKEITENLSVSERQMIEIAKAVSYNAKILILDKPTSSLTSQEVEQLFTIIEKLKNKGMGIVYISHKMEEIMRISDDITIFRDGKWIATNPVSEMDTNKIINLMVGRELNNRFPPTEHELGDVLLKVKNLTGKYPPAIQDVSFTLHEGEILGVAGLVGGGRTEVLETLFGYASKESGEIFYRENKVENTSPKEAIKNGFALLTEERRSTGLFPMMNIQENSVIASLRKYRKGGMLNASKMKMDTDWVIDAMHVKTPSQKTHIQDLSGGNQQKVILGRWLLTGPEILLLDEPTRGIDVGAKYEIYQLIIDLAKQKKGVLMVSSELPELLGICDRILVMSNYRLAGEVLRKDFNQETIMAMATKYL